jgi:hypothetical protein
MAVRLIQTALVVGSLALGLVGGCRDTTPLAEEDIVADAAVDVPLPPDCIGCPEAQCPDLVQGCLDTELCMPMLQCSIEIGCGNLPIEQNILCGVPCALQLGVTSTADPSAVALTRLVGCINDLCPGHCRTEDAGAGGQGGAGGAG